MMAKIPTDTDLWKKGYFRKLPMEVKLLWYYLCTQCNAIGVWEEDWDAVNFYIGKDANDKQISFDESVFTNYPDLFKTRIINFDKGKWLLTGVVWFRYGDPRKFKDVPEGSRDTMHSNLLKMMDKYGVRDFIMGNRPEDLDEPEKHTRRAKDEKPESNNVVVEIIHPLQQKVADYFPNVRKLPDQLTNQQCFTLLNTYPEKIVNDVLESMENYKDLLKKYKSVYLTANNWCKRRLDNGGSGNEEIKPKKEFIRLDECPHCHEKFRAIRAHEPECNKNPKNKIGELPKEVAEITKKLSDALRMSCPRCGRGKDNPTKLCKDKFHE